MKAAKKRICVVGLGHFGRALARTLAQECEVLAIDSDMARVNRIAEDVQRALCLDARDFSALSSAVTDEFDEAIVSIGDELEPSILCALHLKRIGIPAVRAKANTDDHAEILRSLGVTEVISPERETAVRRARRILNPNVLDFLPLAGDYRVVQVVAPDAWTGCSLQTLGLRTRHGVFVLAFKRGPDLEEILFLPGPAERVRAGDALVVIGREQDITQMERQPYIPTQTSA